MERKKVLVVEDDPTLQFVARRALDHLGYECDAVSCGEDALKKDFSQFALIFMDVGLPGIDGINTTMKIREVELRDGRNRVPIVALTAHSEKQECLSSGMDDFLQKPAAIQSLADMLQKWATAAPES